MAGTWQTRAAAIAAALIWAVLGSAAEPPEPGLLFSASFDKLDVTADYSRGNPASTTFRESLELRRAEGISGAGFQLSQGERLDYEMRGNFDVRQGSVSLWVQPVNWEGKSQTYQHFFVARVPGVFNFYIYKYSQPTMLTFYISLGRRQVFARTPADQWHPGNWYKLDCTWDHREMKLYVNSKLESETILPSDFQLPARDDGMITITPLEFWKTACNPEDRTIVDEVKIFDRVLSPSEVRRDWLKHVGEGPAIEPVDVVHEIDTQSHVVRVRLDAIEMARTAGKSLIAEVRLLTAEGELIARKEAPLEDAMGEVELPYPALAPGKHVIQAIVTSADGKRREEVDREFVRPATPWLEPIPKYDHVVPAPWTPVEVDGGRVGVWGREHEFDGGPLPRAITSQGMPLLAAPVALKIDTGAGLADPKWAPAGRAEKHADVVSWSGSGSSGGVRLGYATALEFDGMMRSRLTLSPAGAKATVNAMELTVPVRALCGQYVLAPVLTAWQAGKIELDFQPSVWLTGHHAGLCWFAESPANWVPAAEKKPIQIEHSKDASVLTVHLIAAPVEIDKPVTYTFGLQATPLRPLPDNWRSFNLGGHGQVRGATANITASGGGCFKQSAYLEPSTPEAMRAAVKRCRDAGCADLPYSTPCYLSDHNPVFDFYRLEWRNSEGHKYVGYKGRDGLTYSMIATCPASDFSKLMAYWVENLSRDYDIGGVYFDCCSPSPCSNSRHGCGGVDAFGRRYATYPIFALRGVLKRVFTILHSRGMILVNHAHSRFVPPCHAFSDYWFPGEQYTSRLGRNVWYYTDEMDRDEWRVELSARNKGVGVTFLPEYGRGTDKKYRDDQTAPSRSLLACCVVHDVPCSASYIHLKEMQKVWDLYSKLDLSAADFLPYWEDCPARVDEPLLASAYRLPTVLVVMVSNLTPSPARGTLRIDLKKLHVRSPLTIKDEVVDKELNVPGDAIPVSVAERDYAVISLTWAEKK